MSNASTFSGIGLELTVEQTDEELMRAYVDGDQAAFRALFDRYAPVILRMASRLLRDGETAREITQQTFCQLHGARGDFRLDGESKLRPWLITIAMNLVREQWRRRGRVRLKRVDIDLEAHVESAQARSVIDRLEHADLNRTVLNALDQLTVSQRQIIELHWFQDQPYRDVARIVGCSEGAARVAAHRAYRKLRSILTLDTSD